MRCCARRRSPKWWLTLRCRQRRRQRAWHGRSSLARVMAVVVVFAPISRRWVGHKLGFHLWTMLVSSSSRPPLRTQCWSLIRSGPLSPARPRPLRAQGWAHLRQLRMQQRCQQRRRYLVYQHRQEAGAQAETETVTETETEQEEDEKAWWALLSRYR